MSTHCFPKEYTLKDWDYAGNGWTITSTPDASYANCLKSTREYVQKTNIRRVEEISDRDIYVFAYYYDRAEQAGLLKERDFITVGDYASAAKQACGVSASELGPEHWRPWQCLDLCYIYTLLKDGYGLNDQQTIYVRFLRKKLIENLLFQPTKKLNSMELSWAFGASYHLLNTYHERQNIAEYSCEEGSKTLENKTSSNSTYIGQIFEFISTKTTQLLNVLNLIS
jgi:ectonucleoside triphosphate diphosphohydrolase 5/6